MYNFLLKYFYSWYTIPIILLHELCHILAGFLLGFKLLKINFYKMNNPPLFNSNVVFKFKKYNWKWYIVSFSPFLLILPIVFLFAHPLLMYTALYFISTVMVIDGKFIIIFLPSKDDFDYVKKIKYYSYIVENTSENEFNFYLKTNQLNKLISKNHLLNEQEFFKQI